MGLVHRVIDTLLVIVLIFVLSTILGLTIDAHGSLVSNPTLTSEQKTASTISLWNNILTGSWILFFVIVGTISLIIYVFKRNTDKTKEEFEIILNNYKILRDEYKKKLNEPDQIRTGFILTEEKKRLTKLRKDQKNLEKDILLTENLIEEKKNGKTPKYKRYLQIIKPILLFGSLILSLISLCLSLIALISIGGTPTSRSTFSQAYSEFAWSLGLSTVLIVGIIGYYLIQRIYPEIDTDDESYFEMIKGFVNRFPDAFSFLFNKKKELNLSEIKKDITEEKVKDNIGDITEEKVKEKRKLYKIREEGKEEEVRKLTEKEAKEIQKKFEEKRKQSQRDAMAKAEANKICFVKKDQIDLLTADTAKKYNDISRLYDEETEIMKEKEEEFKKNIDKYYVFPKNPAVYKPKEIDTIEKIEVKD